MFNRKNEAGLFHFVCGGFICETGQILLAQGRAVLEINMCAYFFFFLWYVYIYIHFFSVKDKKFNPAACFMFLFRSYREKHIFKNVDFEWLNKRNTPRVVSFFLCFHGALAFRKLFHKSNTNYGQNRNFILDLKKKKMHPSSAIGSIFLPSVMITCTDWGASLPSSNQNFFLSHFFFNSFFKKHFWQWLTCFVSLIITRSDVRYFDWCPVPYCREENATRERKWERVRESIRSWVWSYFC